MELKEDSLNLFSEIIKPQNGLSAALFSELIYEIEHMDFECNIGFMNVNSWKKSYAKMNEDQKIKFNIGIRLLADKFPEKAPLLYTVIQ